MSEVSQENSSAQLPEELPPVQPPSAGFIVQLFVVPGLIVAAIVVVYVFFGKLATGEQDWKVQLVELRNPNEHRRWRGATGLAQILKADQESGDGKERLSDNREFATALAELLQEELKHGAPSESDLKIQAYLMRAMGLFDLPDLAVPPLIKGLEPQLDREVRKNALVALAVMAERLSRKGTTLNEPQLADELLKTSRDDDPLIRQMASFTLGLFAEEWSTTRLEVMLGDSDFCTRANAAMGLARQLDVKGWDVIKEILEWGVAECQKSGSAAESADPEHLTALKNCLEPAIKNCVQKFSPEQRSELIKLITPIAEKHPQSRIRHDAEAALIALREAK